MTAQTWSVLIVGMAFLLLGVAGSPLAWVALLHRRWRWQQLIERRVAELAETIRTMQENLSEQEAGSRQQTAAGASENLGPAFTHFPARGQAKPAAWSHRADRHAQNRDASPTLIEVPALGRPTGDRQAAVEALRQRYAAIWSLADAGTPLEEIAQAAGQTIGEIELILGLRRKINATRTAIPHAPH
jgi:hypothetical protein